MTTGLMKTDGKVLFDVGSLCVIASASLYECLYTDKVYTYTITITQREAGRESSGGTGICLSFDLWLSKYNPRSDSVWVCVMDLSGWSASCAFRFWHYSFFNALTDTHTSPFSHHLRTHVAFFLYILCHFCRPFLHHTVTYIVHGELDCVLRLEHAHTFWVK